jgi:hypothetical protein
VLAFVIGDLRFARFGDKLQLGAAQRVQQQQAIVVLTRLLPEEARINLLFVREISERRRGSGTGSNYGRPAGADATAVNQGFCPGLLVG